jgi:hypothetical protein
VASRIEWRFGMTQQPPSRARDLVIQQDSLLLSINERLLATWPFRSCNFVYYFHRWNPPNILSFYIISPRDLQWLLERWIARRFRGLVVGVPHASKVLPEPEFGYGPDEWKFWRFLSLLSRVAIDLLGKDSRGARLKALDLHYARTRRTPGFRSALEHMLAIESPTYERMSVRDRESFWNSMEFVGNGQPWDHFFFHFVLGTDPDAGYNPGGEPTRAFLEQELL